MKAFIDHDMNNVILLVNKITNKKEGRILAYWTKNYVCKVMIELYHGNSYNGQYTCAEGSAGGYGYDKFSAALVDACAKAYTTDIIDGEYTEIPCPILTGKYDEISDFTFKSGSDREIIEKKIIPVYPGAGNEYEAFSLYFDYVQVF